MRRSKRERLKLGRGDKVILVCDRYSAYKALRRLLPSRFVFCYCWAHQRCDVDRAASGPPALRRWADDSLKRVGELFHLGSQRKAASQPDRPLERQTAEFARLHEQLAIPRPAVRRCAEGAGGHAAIR